MRSRSSQARGCAQASSGSHSSSAASTCRGQRPCMLIARVIALPSSCVRFPAGTWLAAAPPDHRVRVASTPPRPVAPRAGAGWCPRCLARACHPARPCLHVPAALPAACAGAAVRRPAPAPWHLPPAVVPAGYRGRARRAEASTVRCCHPPWAGPAGPTAAGPCRDSAGPAAAAGPTDSACPANRSAASAGRSAGASADPGPGHPTACACARHRPQRGWPPHRPCRDAAPARGRKRRWPHRSCPGAPARWQACTIRHRGRCLRTA
ncbi:hypothetical protein G6F22_014974 [Rhizopus arrhizus]|nr:hypothetical protein G6F22_014974 [Rhizopus arrhizus]